MRNRQMQGDNYAPLLSKGQGMRRIINTGSPILGGDLKLWLRPMSPGSGATWTDGSGNSLNATLQNGATWNPDSPLRGAVDMSLSGIRYASIATSTPLNFNTSTDSFTLDAWVYKSLNPAALSGIVVKQSSSNNLNYGLYNWSDGSVRFWVGKVDVGVDQAIGPVMALNEWHHVAGVFTATNSMVLFLDGVRVATATYTFGTLAANGTLGIGADAADPANRTMTGRIATVRIWKTALPDAAIRQLYLQPWAGTRL